MALDIGHIVIVIMGLTQAIVHVYSSLNETCKLNHLSESYQKRSLNLSVDAEIIYEIFGNQNGCFINVTEIYENITNNAITDRSEIFVIISFICYSFKEKNDIRFLSSGDPRDQNNPKISAEIVLSVCSVYMEELSHFEQHGKLWSIVTTNSSQIYPASSCSSIKGLRMLSTSHDCSRLNDKDGSGEFFWEFCDEPFEQLFNLRLQGCATHHYNIKQGLLQSKFPKLQTLWLKYVNLKRADLTFLWTNIYIISSDVDIIQYISHYNESTYQSTTSITRSINIYDSDVNLDTDVHFNGNIKEIVVNNVQIGQLNASLFQNVQSMIVLDLSNNMITRLEKNVFLNQNKLIQLNLSKNNLTTLPYGVFDSFRNLLYLDLSSNMITKLDQRLFKHLTSLEKINIESNYITTLTPDFLQDQIASIRYIFLSKNPLETLPLNAFYAPKLSVIDIRRCNITSRGINLLLDNINIYQLQSAYSESLTYDPLGAVGKQPLIPRTVDLSQNHVKEIPINLLRPSTLLKFKLILLAFQIVLDDNPLDCTCKMILSTLLADMYMNEGRLINWECAYPLELRGRYIATIQPSENYCPVKNKYCPEKCACFERLEGRVILNGTRRIRKYVIDCRNVNITKMPNVMPAGQLELWFKNASLVEISLREYLKYTTVLDASNNRINAITASAMAALSNISTLKLDHNSLTYIPIQITTENISLLTLANNPFICDCNTKWMKRWLLQRTSPVVDWNEIECNYNKTKVKQIVSVSDAMFVCEKVPKVNLPEHIVFPSIIIGCILFVLLSISLLIYFQRFTIKVLLYMYCGFHSFDKHNDNNTNMICDVFIIYSYADRTFIRKNLVEKLKRTGFRVVDLYEDIIVGFTFLQNVEKFIKRSKRVIFCWSEDMIESDFILSVWNMVYERAMKNNMDSIILVVNGDINKKKCNNDTLKHFLKSGKFIKQQSKYMFAGVKYLMPRTGIGMPANQTANENAQENTIMLTDCPYIDDLERQTKLIYVTYPDTLDEDIRQELMPYLGQMGYNVRVLDHSFTPGADIREEIHDILNISHNFLFIVSREILQDDVKMFILSTVMSKSVISNNNYLLLFTSGSILEADLTNELENYFSKYVTGSVKEPNFRGRLLQALCSNEQIFTNDEDAFDYENDL